MCTLKTGIVPSITEGVGLLIGQGSSGTGEESFESPTKLHLPCPLGIKMENVGTEKVSKAWLCVLGF